MSLSDILVLVKANLGIVAAATVYDDSLIHLIQVSEEEIKREGVTLDYCSSADINLIVMYTSWMWRKRDADTGMPRMLRYQLNNRILSEKAKTSVLTES